MSTAPGPAIVPDGCWLRVGNETRQWEEGKLLIFDDSFEREAMNPSTETRIVLLFDIWRPELGEDEKAGISAIFDTIDRFTTLPSVEGLSRHGPVSFLHVARNPTDV